jgi:hypothetical protein
MGQRIFDQYTALHFAVGIVVYFWGIGLPLWIGAHVLFEIIENTSAGMHFINTYLTWWPGGKPRADSIQNAVGDTLGGAAGWLFASALDAWGTQRKWYL